MVDGSAHLRLVPHVNRQEMHVGESYREYDATTSSYHQVKIQKNESPVNLFAPDFTKYPNVKFVQQKYQEYLAPGDCIFIPAFYFY